MGSWWRPTCELWGVLALRTLRLAIGLSLAFQMHAFSVNVSRAKVGPTESEYEVRAAFLVVFSRYTQWPESVTAGNNEDFVIGVLGEDPFGTALERMAKSKIEGRTLVVKRFRNPGEIQPCRILYFSGEAENYLAELQGKLARQGVLTIGESCQFPALGGAVQLFLEDGRLRFVINSAALDRAHLTVEAKVLSLAKRVVSLP